MSYMTTRQMFLDYEKCEKIYFNPKKKNIELKEEKMK